MAVLALAAVLAPSLVRAQSPGGGGGWDEFGYTESQRLLDARLSELRRYAEASAAMAAELKDGRLLGPTWPLLWRFGGVIGMDRQSSLGVSLEDLGVFRALSELWLLELLASVRSRRLRLGNNTMEELDVKGWIRGFSSELRRMVEALPGDRLSIAAGYVALFWVMSASLRPDSDGYVRAESFSSLTQAWWLGRQATPVSVSRLCEIGFNAGHSAWAMLASAPSAATMVSFDLVSKSYTRPAAELIRRTFPGRFELVAGPSNETVPEYMRKHSGEERCSIVYIDGGHSAAEARDDLLAMSGMAVHGQTLVVMDDVGCDAPFCEGPTVAWGALVHANRLREMGCQQEAHRRWCWGVYT